MDNAYKFNGICHEHLMKNRVSVIRDTNFVRPEDIHLYDEYFSVAKIATRVSKSPINTVRAYISGKYNGAVTDLLEPNHSGLFYPDIIENSKIPDDFAKRVMNCNKNCMDCGYCKQVMEDATITLDSTGLENY